MKYFIITFLILTNLCRAQDQKTDSLNRTIKTSNCDTCKISASLQLAIMYGSNDPKKAFEISSTAFDLAKKTDHKKYMADALRYASTALYYLGNYSIALVKLDSTLKIYEEIKDTVGCAKTLIWIGNTYYSTANFEKALDAQLQALKLYELTRNKTGIASSLNGIGNVYRSLHQTKKALEFYFKSLVIRQEIGEQIGIAYTYNNIGLIYAEADSLSKSLEYHLKCLQIVQKANDKKGMTNSYGNLGEVYYKLGKYNQALDYIFKSLKISEEISDKNGACASYIEIGKTYSKMGDIKNALINFYKGLAVGKEIDDKDATKDCYEELALTYAKTNEYEKALENFEMYRNIKDTLLTMETSKNMEEMQVRFEADKKQQEIELLQKDKSIRELQLGEQEANIRRQRIIIYSVIGGLGLIVTLIFFILKSYREKRKINIGLERKNIEINRQKDQIEEKNILITDSIDYARNIQNAILPSDEIISKNVPESFVLFLPKDIVSGDFYWLHASGQEKVGSEQSENSQLQTADSVLLAAIDCTGHGVPGAFMSVMAFNMLENIIAEKKLSQPALILDELNRSVLETLHQDDEGSSVKYGMDIALLLLPSPVVEEPGVRSTVQYAGAHNPLCIVRENELIELKANKTTIGMAQEKFTNHSFEAKKGDMLYIYTDGYPDQKGGPDNKKFFAATFKELLISISKNDVVQQRAQLLQTFNDWKKDHEQFDDVLVIGVRI